ncbi:hypothetical protein RHGRI_019415 [Rhododendron griersonianum]|uniref:Uncharacterized protein n=1 Tax=Rhododendron griersonianum TaxID=479676 RepID=A0AAV6JJX2_9ERIC|nr:hypothetical protein RHGRI_019415 [Rhododendron griersonianum]
MLPPLVVSPTRCYPLSPPLYAYVYAYTRFADPPFTVPNERRVKEWRDSKPLPSPIEHQQYHCLASIPSSPSPIACLTSTRTRPCGKITKLDQSGFLSTAATSPMTCQKQLAVLVPPKAMSFCSDLDEVYESNHGNTIVAGLIRGPCVVLPPSKFNEESGRRSRLGPGANDGLQPLYLCNDFICFNGVSSVLITRHHNSEAIHASEYESLTSLAEIVLLSGELRRIR